jgi:hypothetical protein
MGKADYILSGSSDSVTGIGERPWINLNYECFITEFLG